MQATLPRSNRLTNYYRLMYREKCGICAYVAHEFAVFPEAKPREKTSEQVGYYLVLQVGWGVSIIVSDAGTLTDSVNKH